MYIATNSGAGFPFFPTPSPAFIVSRLSDVGVLVGVSFKFVRFRENQVRYPALYLLQKLPRRFGSTLSPHQWGGISYQTTLSFRAQLVGNNMLPSVLALESCRETQGYLWPSLAPPPFQLASTGHVLCVNFCTNLCSIFLCTWAPCPLSSPAFLSIQLAGSSLSPPLENNFLGPLAPHRTSPEPKTLLCSQWRMSTCCPSSLQSTFIWQKLNKISKKRATQDRSYFQCWNRTGTTINRKILPTKHTINKTSKAQTEELN